METQPQNPEFRNNPENFHPCVLFLFFILSKFPNSQNFQFDSSMSETNKDRKKNLVKIHPLV